MLQCYCAAARRAARRLTRVYEAALEPTGMNAAQFELLCFLGARPGLSQTELADAVDVDQTTLSRNVKVLVERGWVQARVGVRDRRLSTYTLTGAGRARLRAAMPVWEQATKSVEASLENKDAVWRVLGELGGAVTGDP